jgi:hypothetical protein
MSFTPLPLEVPPSPEEAAQRRRRNLVTVGALVLFIVLANIVYFNDGDDPMRSTTPSVSQTTPVSAAQAYLNQYGGAIGVYESILSMSDCGSLQAQFDLAAGNNDTATPGSAEHKWTLGYMSAADDRMRSAGCY